MGWTLLRGGGGGWNLTVSDVYKVMLALQADTRLLTDEQKTRMNNEMFMGPIAANAFAGSWVPR